MIDTGSRDAPETLIVEAASTTMITVQVVDHSPPTVGVRSRPSIPGTRSRTWSATNHAMNSQVSAAIGHQNSWLFALANANGSFGVRAVDTVAPTSDAATVDANAARVRSGPRHADTSPATSTTATIVAESHAATDGVGRASTSVLPRNRGGNPSCCANRSNPYTQPTGSVLEAPTRTNVPRFPAPQN